MPPAAGWRICLLALVLTLGVRGTPAAGPPGMALEDAIILPGVMHEVEGVRAEHAYIAAHFPGWQWRKQALINNKGRSFDSIEIVGPDGTTKVIWFDITAWFGKF
jgi:hypothetical protein